MNSLEVRRLGIIWGIQLLITTLICKGLYKQTYEAFFIVLPIIINVSTLLLFIAAVCGVG